MGPFQADILWEASWVTVTAASLGHRRLSEPKAVHLQWQSTFSKIRSLKWLSKNMIQNSNLVCPVLTVHVLMYFVREESSEMTLHYQ